MKTHPVPLQAPPPRAATPALAWLVALATAVAYAAVGGLGLLLAGPPGYASPLYPSAGIALAATLTFGRAALPGVLLGAFTVNAALGLLRDQSGLALVLLPLLIGAGAALQAAVGAALIRRFVSQPVVLNAPRDIALAGGLGAVVACVVSPSVAVPALLLNGAIDAGTALSTWLTWWTGDAVGVLIGAPLALTLIGRPRADWRSRQLTLGLPLLVALLLLAAVMVELNRLDRQRLTGTFERGADRLAAEAQERLSAPVYALQALHSAARARGELDSDTLREASRWWLGQPIPLQAMGYSVRVTPAELPAFEATARAQGPPGYRVFDRDGGAARAADAEVVALRHVEPAAGNAAAIGVNALSIPAARAAIQATRRSGQPAATTGFRLTQSAADETGVVIYQALYRGEPSNEAQRAASFRGVVFVTLRTEAAMAALAPEGHRYLRWCLIDPASEAPYRRLAGGAGCEPAAAGQAPAARLLAVRTVELGGRSYELQVGTALADVPGQQRETAWLLSLAGLASAAMLGALLLTVTGHSRRTELVVQAGTTELRREVAERTQAERALRDSEQRLRSIFDHAPIGVMFLDPRGHIIECNPRLCEMIGHSAKDLRGRSVAEIVHPDDAAHIRRQRRDLFTGLPDAVLDAVRMRPADGRELLVRASASALRDERGRVVRIVSVLEDITEHRRLLASERALHRAEAANRAKSDFLSRMSHELRTPLNAMIGFSQLLGMDREPGLAPHQREWTLQIQRAGWHLLEMINETLDLARIESGAVPLALTPLDLAPLVSASRAMVAASAEQREVTLHERLARNAPALVGDATRVKQILTNLLSNAVKYNRPGGSATVSSRLADDGMVELAVTDTGLGMNEQQLAALFQPYNRLGREATDIEGTGIGLVISRRLAELMGGTLDAASRGGSGSTFTLRLPAAEAAAPAVPERYTDTSPAPYQERRVHYVEDNETNIEVMRGVLALRAQVVLETSTLGLDGMAAIRRNRPDLILLDMQLPDISGIELLRHLKRDDMLADIPVVVVSADASPLHMQQALTLGAAHYMTKPLDVSRFLGIIDKLLEAAETRW
ncbi:MAG: CHASE domain-containing protein [Rubrivivax sp.]|nr:CHASE domain-containing protein [Rubrivivax sp.]